MKRLTVLAATALLLAWMPSAQAANFTLTQTVVGSGTVASSPAGIACPTDCTESYAAGTVVTLTATPDAGSTFDHWTGSVCTGKTQPTCTVTMSNTRAITATFTGGGGGNPPVVLVLFENHSRNAITAAAAPYLTSFANAGTSFTHYNAIEHPSLPNYLDITSGTNSGCHDDRCARHSIGADNIFNQVGDWQAWNESMPSNCAANTQGRYAVKHNAPPYYTDLNATCPTRDIPYPATLPNPLHAFTFVTPNLCSDMHDCSVQTGDAWASNHVPAILARGAIVIITFDEGSGSQNVFTAVRGPGISPSTNTANFTHYSLLAALEDFFGVARLANAAGKTPLPI